MYKILIVEDEEPIANLVAMSLRKVGYLCETVYDGKSAADKMQEHHYDLGIFDIMLPELDGYELLQYAKSLSLPVIFLTAKEKTLDKVKGFSAGADDYITKPFEILELQARVANVLRHYNKQEQKYYVKDLEINGTSRVVTKAGVPLDLTYKEFDVLMMLIKNPNIALYREVIYEQVWDSPFLGDSRTVDLHVQRIRRKTGLMKEIVCVYKVGYRLDI